MSGNFYIGSRGLDVLIKETLVAILGREDTGLTLNPPSRIPGRNVPTWAQLNVARDILFARDAARFHALQAAWAAHHLRRWKV